MHNTSLVSASDAHQPTPAHQAILPWLGMLRQLYPPSALLLVGAGSDGSPWVQYLLATGHRNVTLIEADEAAAKRLKLATQGQPDWNVEPHVIGRHSEATAFYTASLQTESGLLEPEALRSLWPNLKTIHKQTRQTVTLAKLLESAETPANWLLLDCLPALPIIQGAASQLAGIDVIVVRVVLNAQALPDSGASAEELQPALQALGFRCLAIETSRHPAIGHALFVRDTAALAQQLQQQLAQQTQTLAQAQAQAKAQAETATAAAAKQAEERAAQVQRLTQANAAANQLATERQAQLDQLQAQLKQATEQAQAATQEAEKAKAAAAAAAMATSAATATAAKQTEERAAQVQQLTQAKAAADQLATERQTQLDQLQAQLKQATEQAQAAAQAAEKVKAAAAAAEKATATATAATAAAAKQVEEHAAQVQQLTQAKVAADKLASERQQQIDQLQHKLSAASTVTSEHTALLKTLLSEVQIIKAQDQLAPALSTLETPWVESLRETHNAISNEIRNSQESILKIIKSISHDNSDKVPILEAQKKTIDDLSLKMNNLIAGNTFNDTLQSHLGKQLAATKDAIKEFETRMNADLGKGLGNAVKQIEAFLRIQSFLGSSDAIGDFHGWPISPDIGIFLLERMREQQYDLIIEFGSGTSTALFAKATEAIEQHRGLGKQPDDGESGQVSPRTEIVTFEHDTLYHGKTMQMLKARGLDQRVSLVHAPLVDWRDGEKVYLYYDCQRTLMDLADKYRHSKLRILLLVDGPPGNTCLNARYPAVPFVFSTLGMHKIDVVLDDAGRPEEKQVIELWKAFWKKRSIHRIDTDIPSEKGIYLSRN